MSAPAATEVRDGWRMARVGDILKVRNGYAFKSTDYKTEGVPLIRQSDLGDDVVDIAEAKCVDPRFLSELPSFVVRDGDLLIGMSGSLGKIARYQHPEPALQNQRTGLLQVKPGHEAKFAKLVLKFVEPQILAEGKGIAVQNVSASEIEGCTFPLPSPDEQRRIVAEIEKQFTRLEAGVAALRRVQANLKRYRAAVLKAACEGQIVPTEAELHRQRKTKSAPLETGAELLTRILAERRKNWTGRGQYKEPAAPDTTNLPPLPEGWTWATFGQLCRVQGGFAFKSADYVKEGIPLVRISNLVNGRVQVAEDTVFLPPTFADENPDFLLRRGDVLIAMSGATTGKMATMEDDLPALLNQRVGRFVLSSAELSNSKFISFLVQQISAKVLKDAYGAAQPNISPSEIEEMPVPLPPLAEQTRIVAEVERRLSVVEELESVVSANLQRATRLRQSILQKAFTGELC